MDINLTETEIIVAIKAHLRMTRGIVVEKVSIKHKETTGARHFGDGLPDVVYTATAKLAGERL